MEASTQAHRERAWVEVDLTKLVHNARTAQAAARGARLLPMVKADAYGLGALPVVRALEAVEPWGYGVAATAEGAYLAATVYGAMGDLDRGFAELERSRDHGFAALATAEVNPALDPFRSDPRWGPFLRSVVALASAIRELQVTD